MVNFLEKNLSSISFLFVPVVFLWNPEWIGFLGIQPYWPLIWLLPWSMVYGSTNGLIAGLFLGLILDSLTIDNSFTQVPGLVLCGFCFGRLKLISNVLIEHFRHGLICSIGTFFCSSLYFSQILIKNIPDNILFLFFPSIKNVFAQVFITGLFAPFLCSRLLIIFRKARNKKKLVRFSN